MNLSDYYKFTITIQRNSGVSNRLDLTYLVEDYGTNGISAPTTLLSTSGSLTNAALYSDSSTYAGFGSTEGFSNNFDNFSTSGGTTVPEPAGVALLGLGGAMLAGIRRRAHRMS